MSSTAFFCRADHLELSYGRAQVTSTPLSFGIPSGKLTAVVGRNGAGKSTLLRAILGDPVQRGGEIWLGLPCLGSQALPLSKLTAGQRASTLAFVPQDHQFPPQLRLVDFLRLAFLPQVGLFGKLPPSDLPEILATLESFGLTRLAQRPLGSLSTGERQKAFLARAILQGPALLLLDEPTNHLDPGAVHAFWSALLGARRSTPVEILVSTHDLAFVKHHAQWVLALENGKVAFNGSSEQFWAEDQARALFGEVFPV